MKARFEEINTIKFSVIFCIVGLKMQMLCDEKNETEGIKMDELGNVEEGFL